MLFRLAFIPVVLLTVNGLPVLSGGQQINKAISARNTANFARGIVARVPQIFDDDSSGDLAADPPPTTGNVSSDPSDCVPDPAPTNNGFSSGTVNCAPPDPAPAPTLAPGAPQSPEQVFSDIASDLPAFASAITRSPIAARQDPLPAITSVVNAAAGGVATAVADVTSVGGEVATAVESVVRAIATTLAGSANLEADDTDNTDDTDDPEQS